MKKLLLISLVCLLAAPIMAHPPKDIMSNYDTESQILTIIIPHPTQNPKEHYINNVVVGRGGKNIMMQKFNNQFDDKKQVVKMMLPNVKDVIELRVQATCNKFGQNSALITVRPELKTKETVKLQKSVQQEIKELKLEQKYEELPEELSD